ncbi:hypothetical protein [Tabrizicola sp.]
MPRLLLIACLTLAACGANGDPQAPSQSGVTFGGKVAMGVGGN